MHAPLLIWDSKLNKCFARTECSRDNVSTNTRLSLRHSSIPRIIQPACKFNKCQLARFGAGCYIEMATSSHQPCECKLVGGWKRIFGEKQVIAGPFMNQCKKFQPAEQPKFCRHRSRRFDVSRRWLETGCFARFSGPRGPKWNATAEPSTPRLPFFHDILGFY